MAGSLCSRARVAGSVVLGLLVSLAAADGPSTQLGPPAPPARATKPAPPVDGNRLAYLDEPCDPYYVGRHFPKLITPQWVGEDGVDAVVTLGIDDMRDPAKYEAYLRPILDRLKKIDNRAPVSIMTCKVNPADRQLHKWLLEGLSIECHTADHPCPIWKDRDFDAAKKSYDDCVDQVNQIVANKPVAFRTPCCDSRNTVSPKLFAEIINRRTQDGKQFLTIDSSVMNLITPNDAELPRDLVLNPDGTDRFKRYVPSGFVNTIEDYPYPYVINGGVWEFPCVTPSDWSGQNVNGKNNARTVADWKAALDAVVIKKGVFNLVFHPHGWIKPEQIVELIEYAQATYGKRVKFLNFRECQERLDKNLLAGQPLREPKSGDDNGVRLFDVDNDGLLDVSIGNPHRRETRIYSPASGGWLVVGQPARYVLRNGMDPPSTVDVRFGIVGGRPVMLAPGAGPQAAPLAWRFDGEAWRRDSSLAAGMPQANRGLDIDNGIRLRDVDGDGTCELVVKSYNTGLYFRDEADAAWKLSPGYLPDTMYFNTRQGPRGTRFVDVDEDGKLDLFLSDEDRAELFLFESMQAGWKKMVFSRKREDDAALSALVPIVATVDGISTGFFVRNRAFYWQNENTAKEPDLVLKRTFGELLGDRLPEPKSPAASLKTIVSRPGFKVQLVASEPQVQDPVAFAFGADGKLWVVEMGDYPSGTDGKDTPGGKVKVLTDADGDGFYETATTFLENLPFPTGVTPCRNGVLVTAAPEIFFAADTDGDGKADVRETLFTGFGQGNQQHRVNGLTYGLDNWFYGANGHSDGQVRSLKTGKVLSIHGRDFRLRPDTGEFATAAGPTQFVRSRDDWGNWFGNDNTHPMFHWWAEERYHDRNRFLPPAARVEVPDVPGAAPVFPISKTLTRFNEPTMANHFTSACSTFVYRDDLFGPGFAGNMFVSEPVHNLVSRQVMRAEGTTFKSARAADEQRSEFLASSDSWFRPTMIAAGPDGAIYVADMYRLVIEHPKWIPAEWQAKLDLRAGSDKGRIYRVTPIGAADRPVPRLDKMSVEQLVAALDSPSGWQRDTAQRLMVERGDKTAVPLLAKLAAESKNPLARLHALCALDGLRLVDDNGVTLRRVLPTALNDAHPGVRRHAVRLAETMLFQDDKLAAAVVGRATDPDPQVRMQVAYTLGELVGEREAAALGTLLRDNADQPMIVTAAMSSLPHAWLGEAAAAALVPRDGEAGVSLPLVTAFARMAVAGRDSRPVEVMVSTLMGPPDKPVATWRFSAVAAFADADAAFLDDPRGNSWMLRLIQGNDRDTGRRLLKLMALAMQTAADPDQPDDRRVAAIGLIGRPWGGREQYVKAIHERLLTPQSSDAVQAAAVSAVARAREEVAPGLLLGAWGQSSPAVRNRILDELLARPAWAGQLLDAIAAGTVKAAEVDAVRRQALLRHKEKEVAGRAATLLAGGGNPDRQQAIDWYLKSKIEAPDAKRGVAIFTKTCAACHAVGGIGKAVGPDLAGVGDKSPQGLLTAILDPNRAVEPRYVAYDVEIRAGETVTGILAAESAEAVTVIGPDGKRQDVPRLFIKSMKSTALSLMPDGLERGLSAQDMADLIAFVREAKPGELLKAKE